MYILVIVTRSRRKSRRSIEELRQIREDSRRRTEELTRSIEESRRRTEESRRETNRLREVQGHPPPTYDAGRFELGIVTTEAGEKNGG